MASASRRGRRGGWIEASFRDRPGLEYIHCSGLDMVDAYRGAREAAHFARTQRKPVFLHMDCVRLYGHAGSDLQASYLTKKQIEEDEERDPLLYSAALLVEQEIASAERHPRHLQRDRGDARPDRRAGDHPAQAHQQPRGDGEPGPAESARRPGRTRRRRRSAKPCSPATLGMMEKPQHMARLLSWTLADLLLAQPTSSSRARMSGPRAASTAEADAGLAEASGMSIPSNWSTPWRRFVGGGRVCLRAASLRPQPVPGMSGVPPSATSARALRTPGSQCASPVPVTVIALISMSGRPRKQDDRHPVVGCHVRVDDDGARRAGWGWSGGGGASGGSARVGSRGRRARARRPSRDALAASDEQYHPDEQAADEPSRHGAGNNVPEFVEPRLEIPVNEAAGHRDKSWRKEMM